MISKQRKLKLFSYIHYVFCSGILENKRPTKWIIKNEEPIQPSFICSIHAFSGQYGKFQVKILFHGTFFLSNFLTGGVKVVLRMLILYTYIFFPRIIVKILNKILILGSRRRSLLCGHPPAVLAVIRPWRKVPAPPPL